MNNNEIKNEQLKIRPYARLLTMLGDQLIKNELIALTELVKNSYDADADFCNVEFCDFDINKKNKPISSIIIDDNGYGMSYDIITKHFLNPATPIKKKGNELRQSKKGRICQGEKGIGRFSMLKLGKKVTIYSKEEFAQEVHKVVFDFTKYDDEFLMSFKTEEDIYLDELVIEYESMSVDNIPLDISIKKYNYGTAIIIESLKGEWDVKKIEEFEKDMLRFCPFEVDQNKIVENMDFNVKIFINDNEERYKESKLKEIENLIEDKSLYKIFGKYDESERRLIFSYIEANEKRKEISLSLVECQERNSLDFQAIKFFQDNLKKYYENGKTTICGDFKYEFYVFDFDSKQNEVFGLTTSQKELVRDHRIFLYRDGIRVQPYGAADDDWLQIDRTRASDKAGNMFSNDQLIGQIAITKNKNPNLRDKTSREGIIEDNESFSQFSKIIKGLLAYIRIKLYQNYKFRQKQNNEQKLSVQKKAQRTENIEKLLEFAADNKPVVKIIKNIEKDFKEQERVFDTRLGVAERLAGVGLSVETASHDIMLTIERLKDCVHDIYIESIPSLINNIDEINIKAQNAEGMVGLVYMKMKDLQQIFVSSKQRAKNIHVEDILIKIKSIYAKSYKEKKITIDIIKEGKSPVVAKTIDAVLFQVFINLFDNSLYWLSLQDSKREVKIYLNGDEQTVIFSDNGPGVALDDSPFVFDAFYSGKGEEGRGLGLYIAKILLNRYKYDIELLTDDFEKKLSGANFRISFISGEK